MSGAIRIFGKWFNNVAVRLSGMLFGKITFEQIFSFTVLELFFISVGCKT